MRISIRMRVLQFSCTTDGRVGKFWLPTRRAISLTSLSEQKCKLHRITSMSNDLYADRMLRLFNDNKLIDAM